MKNYNFYFIILFVLFCFFLWQGIYLAKNPAEKESKIFSIKKGESVFQIAKNLEEEGLIKNRWYFDIYTFLKGKEKRLQAGEYLLSQSLNVAEIVKKIVSGQTAKEKITIIEGWNLNDTAKYLTEKGFSAEEFLELTNKDFSGQFDFLKDKPKNLSLEGYLFPDTYEINKKEELEKLILKILENFEQKLNSQLKKDIFLQGKKIFEIVTMASLIEKEVQTLDDKKIVSGILWKRIKEGIPLQVDATITYITGQKTTKISIEDTQIDSSYNTYKNRGLPMGPISNPGIESIIAAIYPKESDYFYYLSTPEGKTIFSKTLQEHNLAKAKYLKP